MKSMCKTKRESIPYQYSEPLSQAVAIKHADLFLPNQCYLNVYRLMTESIAEFAPGSQLSVLFCYRIGVDGYYYRHAFCVVDTMLVEPLLYLDMSETNLRRLIPVRLLEADEYFTLVCNEESADLSKSLYQHDLAAVEKNGLRKRLRGYDLSRLYRQIAE